MPVDLAGYEQAFEDIVGILARARSAAARSVNQIMTATYWQIGRRIVEVEQIGTERANYGEAVLARLSEDLTQRFGRGFSERNLRQIRRFYLTWPSEEIRQTTSAELPTGADEQIRQTPSAESVPGIGTAVEANVASTPGAFPLPWSAYVCLLRVKTAEARRFYEAEALRNGWTVRQLARQIDSMLYERTALSRDKAAVLAKGARSADGDELTPAEAIRDPFVLEFLDLKDEYSETDLEDALITHLAEFLLELGDDFAFLGRQRRMRIGDSWYRVDLAFVHRSLRCLLLVDLKLGRFSHADAGQMTMYLNYAREHWVKPGENPPVGLIMCADKDAEEARYALEALPNPVLASEYRLALPDETALEAELARTRQELDARFRGGAIANVPVLPG